MRSILRKLFGRHKREERSSGEEWYWAPEGPVAAPAPPAWTLPSPTAESLERAQAEGFVTSPAAHHPSPPQETPYQPPQAVPDFEATTLPAATGSGSRDDGRYTILEHNTEPIGGYLEDLDVFEAEKPVEAEKPPRPVDDYRYAQEPDRDTLEAVYLPAAPPEPLPGTTDAFSSVEQPAPPEPPPPPPIAVARSSGSLEKVEGRPPGAEATPRGEAREDTRVTGSFGQKREGPPAFAAEPDVRHVVLGFRDGTAVFLEPEHPLFSLFFQWSELVAGPETPPKAYARRQAQHKIYLGKPPRGMARETARKKAGN